MSHTKNGNVDRPSTWPPQGLACGDVFSRAQANIHNSAGPFLYDVCRPAYRISMQNTPIRALAGPYLGPLFQPYALRLSAFSRCRDFPGRGHRHAAPPPSTVLWGYVSLFGDAGRPLCHCCREDGVATWLTSRQHRMTKVLQVGSEEVAEQVVVYPSSPSAVKAL